MATTNRILLAKGPNGSNLDQLFEVKNNTSAPHTLVLNSNYDLSANNAKYYLNCHLENIANISPPAFVVAPKAGKITKISSVIDATVDADTVITVNVNGGTDVTNTLTIALAGSAVGDIDTVIPGDNNVVGAGDYIKLTSDGGSTTHSKAVFTIEISPN